MISGGLTSGKHTKNYGKSPFLIGKSTVDEPFSTAMLNAPGVEMVWNTSFFCLCSCGSCLLGSDAINFVLQIVYPPVSSNMASWEIPELNGALMGTSSN